MSVDMGAREVLLYTPNLVGYFRIVLLLCALCTGFAFPWTTFYIFSVDFLLDYVDGLLARTFNQVE